MSKRTTIQDIADSLGLSRNTVSKALNGNNAVPAATKSMIIQRAIDLKYKHFSSIEKEKKTGNIALFTSAFPSKAHFGDIFLSGLERRISEKGYTLSIYILRQSDLDSLTLPSNFDPDTVIGIVCIELFDVEYSKLISSLGIPTIFTDTYVGIANHPLNADVIMMENYYSTYSMTTLLIKNGIKEFGFIGDYKHCRSFNERWNGFLSALNEHNIYLDKKQCLIEDDKNPYSDITWLTNHLKTMPKIPKAFICANDYHAINVIKALKEMNLTIPGDVVVCGFDDSPESEIIEPKLTTVHIFSNDMGLIAAKMLFDRIEDPSLPYQRLYINTSLKYRDSTGILEL
jgi:LacI family transcriptional regulator